MIIATIRPNAVVKSACEIPPATTAGEISLAALIASNADIIPTTVPVKPIIGATVITVFSQIIFFSRNAISSEPAFSMAFSTSSSPRSYLDKAA